MAAATRDLGSSQSIGSFYELPPKAGSVFYYGTLAGDKNGEAVPVVGNDPAIKRIGVVESIRGPQGSPVGIGICVDPMKTLGPFQNGTAGDALVDADSGADVWGIDNQTVGKTNGGGTRSWLGYLYKVDATGVYVSKVKK